MTRELRPVTPEYVIAFIKKIHEDPTNFGTFWTVYCGMHSGIPECCIAYHVKISIKLWYHLPLTNEEMDELEADPDDPDHDFLRIAYSYMDWWRKGKDPEKWAPYTPCPACLLKREFVMELADCDCRKQRKELQKVHRKLAPTMLDY
jgi:hypothetical protein